MRVLTAALALIFLATFPVSAEDGGELSRRVAEEFDTSRLEELLPDEVGELLGSPLIPDGSAPTERSILDYAVKAALSLLKPILSKLCLLCAAAIGASLLKKLCDAADSPAVYKAFSFALVLTVGTLCALTVIEDCKAATEFFNWIKAFFAAAIPVMTGIYCLGGNVAVAAASGASGTVLLSAVELLCEKAVIPFAKLSLALCISASMTSKADLSHIRRLFCSLSSKLLCFIMGIVGTGTVFRTLAAASVDGLAAKSVKFAASAFIPVVGGAVSEATGTVMAAVSAVKGSFGVFGALSVCLMILPCVLRLFLNKLAFTVAGSVFSALDCTAEGKLVSDMGGVYDILIAAAVCVGVCFIIFCSLFINTACVR